MIKPIIIRKDPNSYEHLQIDIKGADYDNVINNVDLKDITEFLMDLNNLSWVPMAYWKNKGKCISEPFYIGEIDWVIYSYLTICLVIEDKYFGYSASRVDKYIGRSDYYNPLERSLYRPITDRLAEEGYIDKTELGVRGWYKLGKSYLRGEKLKELGI